MTPTKLSDSDKSEILRLYRQSDENTITLAKRYGVSSSTVRRILQSALSDFEYESLVHQKQKRLPDRASVLEPTEDAADSSQSVSESDPLYPPVSESRANSSSRLRRHSLSTGESIAGSEARSTLLSGSGISHLSEAEAANLTDRSDEFAVAGKLKNEIPESGMLAGEDFSDFDDGEDEEEDDDTDLDDFDAEDLDEADSLFAASLLGVRSRGASGELRAKTMIQVLPLSEASIPKICYLVVDRAAELIVRPLKAFGELGQIPPEEIREKTLPVFDNHRVARRFSTRNQRVCNPHSADVG